MEAGAARISDLFDVRQGVRTGDNRAFILGIYDYETLPKKEQVYFKPAVMNQSIQDGQLQSFYWVFYPYNIEGPRFTTEEEMLKAVPVYAERFLIPKRERLLGRTSLTRANRKDWWGLSERDRPGLSMLLHVWFQNISVVQVVSQLNLTPSFLVVQGYVWFLKNDQPADEMEEDEILLPVDDLLCAYMSIMNSRRLVVCWNSSHHMLQVANLI